MKIVTAEEMRRIESLGLNPSKMMDLAGEAIALFVEKLIYETHQPKRILLVVGKGNNGGDAYTAGSILLAKGFHVEAARIFPLNGSSPLCRERHDQFVKQGGKVSPLKTLKAAPFALIIDGLVGTGFQGKATDELAEAIDRCNDSAIPIVAIDIPSGLNGSTGAIESVAISAIATLYLGLPKLGFFVGQGWDVVGKLVGVDIGLAEDGVREEAILLEKEALSLPTIRRSRHKYEAGYVLGVAGSPQMPGAASLASKAALRSGAGVVRLFADHPTHLINEVIREKYSLARIREESKRASAFFVGPGVGRTPAVGKRVKQLLTTLKLPCVIDGDALFFLAKNRQWKIPKNAVLTPHNGEMERLLNQTPSFKNCQQFVEKHQTTVILKGAPTVVFHPHEKPVVVIEGDPGMATAGSGDVLTGVVASLLAQQLKPQQAALLAAYLHGSAGEFAADDLTSYCMAASDLIDYFPIAFATLETTEQTFPLPLPE